MRRLAFAACLALALPAVAAAQPAPPAKSLSAMPAGAYKLDPRHASLTAKVRHMGYSNYTMRFDKLDGGFTYDAKTPARSKLEISVDPKSVNSGVKALDDELQGAEWFNTAAHSAIRFVSRSITLDSDGDEGKVTGDLTFLGVTKPVTLDVDWNGVGKGMGGETRTGFSAETTIRRSDFGFTKYVPVVGDEVKLLIEVEFTQPKAGA